MTKIFSQRELSWVKLNLWRTNIEEEMYYENVESFDDTQCVAIIRHNDKKFNAVFIAKNEKYWCEREYYSIPKIVKTCIEYDADDPRLMLR